ncbi:amidohydrolase family protein [Pseudonocardia hydrocarbonoxydans]|uniref:Putative amidohydrolase n=1 Tax=Pseudonocardia hydrocarbonoxydans TaxID=76726 RepID=A0A4Y3WQB5_9PSEU|nr:putative amidohydrolase [Pseudonocardia hydrocarbonoxydans]
MYRLRGVLLPGEDTVELFVDGDGILVEEPIAGAETLVDGGWIVPGLVDAHCHVGLGPDGPVDLEEADAQARRDRDAGALLLRDCGSPVDTSALQARDDLPEIIRAGRHLARPKRYIPGLAIDADDPALLPDLVAEQAAVGDGWVKLVGDWIDRGVGDLAPLWPDDVLRAAIDAAHAAGARVTAHVFGTDALPGLIGAGIDCIEHGTGLTDDLIAQMAQRGTALVPTLINVDTFPAIADSASRYPTYAAHMRELHAGAHDVVRRAVEAGVPVFAGTDAGGGIAHGRIADEIRALAAAGHTDALGAASWNARAWLGRPAPHPGLPADLVVYRTDPRSDLAALDTPALVMLRGRVVAA